jgi:hypothetical protein
MDRVKLQASGTGATDDPPLRLPQSVPEIEPELVEAAMRRSPRARRLHRRLQQRAEMGKPLSEREVEKMVDAATGAQGEPDGNQAVIIAEHARRNPRLFRGGHGCLLRFLERVVWQVLIGDLRAFMAQIKEQEVEQRKRDDIKRDLEVDRLEVDARRNTLLRTERVRAATKPPVNPKLEADNKLRLTLERMKRT